MANEIHTYKHTRFKSEIIEILKLDFGIYEKFIQRNFFSNFVAKMSELNIDEYVFWVMMDHVAD